MAPQNPTPESPENQEEERKSKLRRRDFLQVGALSLAAASCASVSPAHGGGNGLPSNGKGPKKVDPPQPIETWNAPWVWRPSEWPGQQLHLNVVENENPGAVVGFGNPNGVLFSYGGSTPGPTIRMRGNETLFVKLRNMLAKDDGVTYVKEYPDPNELVKGLTAAEVNAKSEKEGNKRYDYCLGEHTNGVHSEHVTNLHTHGLHVRPGKNPDGTHSDNVILRVMSQGDFLAREKASKTATCEFLRDPEQIFYLKDDEQAGEADYEFKIGDVEGDPNQAHPPGTFWYHPHSHGATHNQVASGMAGFLIVEGAEDDAVNEALTDQKRPNPELKTGKYDYRERLVFIQKVFFTPTDSDASTQDLKKNIKPTGAVNGKHEPMIMTMRPGAIERWRVLNGSVDGKGYKRFMVLKGQYVLNEKDTSQLEKVLPDGKTRPVSQQEIEEAKANMYQMAMDGITLISVKDGKASYTIKDLSKQNQNSQNPLANSSKLSSNPTEDRLLKYQAVFKNGKSLRDAYVRPNEIYLAPANRADVFFKAPRLGSGQEQQVYTILAKSVVLHSDKYQQDLQNKIQDPTKKLGLDDELIVAYVVVTEGSEKKAPIPDFDVMSLINHLPEVPQYLQPVSDDDLRIAESNDFRTRTITYSGWGSQDYPLVTTDPENPSSKNFSAFIAADTEKRLEKLIYYKPENTDINVLMPAAIRTMAIDGRKFSPTDPLRPRMLLDTAEEWALYNYSGMLWGNTDTTTHPQPGQYSGHYISYPISRKEGQDKFADDHQFKITAKGVDHPFHIHQNPFWVMRIEIPDENGNLHNILDEPRWQDVIWMPRNRGRVVFRSRFPDYVGTFVNHCHILLHEDNGMMQPVEITPYEDQANFEEKDKVSSPAMSSAELDALYPRASREVAYTINSKFVDPNHKTGQNFPGFDLVVPSLDDA